MCSIGYLKWTSKFCWNHLSPNMTAWSLFRMMLCHLRVLSATAGCIQESTCSFKLLARCRKQRAAGDHGEQNLGCALPQLTLLKRRGYRGFNCASTVLRAAWHSYFNLCLSCSRRQDMSAGDRSWRVLVSEIRLINRSSQVLYFTRQYAISEYSSLLTRQSGKSVSLTEDSPQRLRGQSLCNLSVLR